MNSAARLGRLGACILLAVLMSVGDAGAAGTGPAPGKISPLEQTAPAVSFDGTNYFVLWDQFDPNLKTGGIFGTRVRPDGTVLDRDGIEIVEVFRGSPKLAFDGTNYLVIWTESRSDGAGFNIWGARVSPDGVVLDPGGFPISTASGAQSTPALAFDGTNFMVVWDDGRPGYPDSDIYAARVSPAGTVLDPDGIPISTAPSGQVEPGLAFDGTNYLVTWHDWRSGTADIYGTRLSPAGTVLDPGGIPISTAPGVQYGPKVAFDGSNFLVAWTDWRSGCSAVWGARVTRAGTVLDPNGITVSTGTCRGAPVLAFDGVNYLAVWEDFRSGPADTYGARVSPSGTVLVPVGIQFSTAACSLQDPALGFDG
jgi:hypothetical protein